MMHVLELADGRNGGEKNRDDIKTQGLGAGSKR